MATKKTAAKKPVDLGDEPVLPKVDRRRDPMAEAEKAVLELRAERDALAARVLELEAKPCVVPPRKASESDEHKALRLLLEKALIERDEEIHMFKEFLRSCLRTASFNSTVASALVK